MKNILITLFLLNINICVFAQRTNSRGEYLVKNIHWVNAFTQKEVGNKGDKWYHSPLRKTPVPPFLLRETRS